MVFTNNYKVLAAKTSIIFCGGAAKNPEAMPGRKCSQTNGDPLRRPGGPGL